MLVLQDGRDLAIAFLGSQEWNGLTQPLEDLGKVEMVRGPGSALYGANAFKKGSVSLTYAGQQGVDANVTVRLVDGYQWAAGVFQGYVPSSEFVNLSAGYRVNNYFRVHAAATNLFDEKRFQLYGGSVIGRRVLGGITATF